VLQQFDIDDNVDWENFEDKEDPADNTMVGPALIT
jgi:hypothetical protein